MHSIPAINKSKTKTKSNKQYNSIDGHAFHDIVGFWWSLAAPQQRKWKL